MAKIIPFKAIRPTRDKAQLVTSRPYYAYTELMLAAKLKGNPYSFIHIINPEFEIEDKTEPNTPERFQKHAWGRCLGGPGVVLGPRP